MSDFKSKLPDFKEVTSIAGKLFKDVRQSVTEIIADYKKKRARSEVGDVVSSAPKKAKKEDVTVATVKKTTSTTGEEEVATVATAKKRKPAPEKKVETQTPKSPEQ